MRRYGLAIAVTLLLAASAYAQGARDIAVQTDKQNLSEDSSWVYDDLDSALEAAERSKRPLMVVFR